MSLFTICRTVPTSTPSTPTHTSASGHTTGSSASRAASSDHVVSAAMREGSSASEHRPSTPAPKAPNNTPASGSSPHGTPRHSPAVPEHFFSRVWELMTESPNQQEEMTASALD